MTFIRSVLKAYESWITNMSKEREDNGGPSEKNKFVGDSIIKDTKL